MKFARGQAINDVIFNGDCEHKEEMVAKKISLLSKLMPERSYDEIKKISLFMDSFLKSYMKQLKRPSYINLMKKLDQKIKNAVLDDHSGTILILREFTKKERTALCSHIDNILKNIDVINKNPSWYGLHYKETVTEKRKNIAELSKSKMDKNKSKSIEAIKSFIDNNNLDKLYEAISGAKIPKELDLQIRKKINKSMQYKTNDSEIVSEDDKTNLSKLVESFHTHCKTSGKLFAEELSSCFDLANKEIVSERFRSQLGL